MREKHPPSPSYNMFKVVTPRKRTTARIERNKIYRRSDLGSGQVFTFGLIAFCILSIVSTAGAMSMRSHTRHYVENVDTVIEQADRLLNENRAIALVAPDEQLKPFVEHTRLDRKQVPVESQIIKVIPSKELDLQRSLDRTLQTGAIRQPSRGFLGPLPPTQEIFQMVLPVKRVKISSRYGWRHGRAHRGIDLEAPVGTPIYAAEKGVVTMASPYYGYGNLLVIDHGNGIKTRYAHLAKILVRKGAKIYKDQMVGTVGMTGSSTGPHLHFEVISNGRHQNPERFVLR